MTAEGDWIIKGNVAADRDVTVIGKAFIKCEKQQGHLESQAQPSDRNQLPDSKLQARSLSRTRAQGCSEGRTDSFVLGHAW